MGEKTGKQTVKLNIKPSVISAYSVVGPKEGQGPLKPYFDQVLCDDMCSCKSFELAESKMHYDVVANCISNAGLQEADVDYIFAGDLLNQLMSSTFMARDLDISFLGIYGACSTFAEALILAAMSVEAGFGNNVIASTSSHFSSAERQFRLPLEMGSQRSPVSQWTVTGAGAMLISSKNANNNNNSNNIPKITYVTAGKVKDYGIKDANEMGAAMAPAAVDTMKQHFMDTGRNPSYYDLIISGDLGSVGKTIVKELIKEYGYDIENNYVDCGDEIFDAASQGTFCGGSGAACSASVMSGLIYKSMLQGKYKKILFVATGALLSSTSTLQGQTIPCIAHAVAMESEEEKL